MRLKRDKPGKYFYDTEKLQYVIERDDSNGLWVLWVWIKGTSLYHEIDSFKAMKYARRALSEMLG